MLRFNIRPTATVRAAVFIGGDILIWGGSLLAAFLIRFDGDIPARYLSFIPLVLLVLIPIKLTWHLLYRLHQLTWRSVGLPDLLNIVKANTFALLTIATVAVLLRDLPAFRTIPRSVLLLDYILSVCAATIFRVSRRGWQLQREVYLARRSRNGTRLLVIGAGAAGGRIVQTIREAGGDGYHLAGFVDDDPGKQGAYILGLPVLGGSAAIPWAVRTQGVQEVLIAMPSAPPGRIQEIVEEVRRTGLKRIKILPGAHEWLAGRDGLKDIRDVKPQDLLQRPPVRIQYDALHTYFAGKRVLVTGAAGSIGSELVRQLSRFAVEQVVAADMHESGLFELEQEFVRDRPEVPLRSVIANVTDGLKIEWLMANVRPHLVFHAAAYKHVPLMEREIEEAVKTNVFGTLTVAEAALRHGVETFVFISTDKAVNPASIMGASKRVGELITQSLGTRGRTRFLGVRFGNVLGSRGSIFPVIQEQIQRGAPVTITHPDMVRYFMSIAEAVLLVLQTPLMTGGQIFMLDMGEPVRVVDLVRELIRLSGLEVDRDIPIVFSGIRPGEKVEEELVMPSEQVWPTQFERIMEVRADGTPDEVTLRLALQELDHLVRVFDGEGIRSLLRRLTQTPMLPSADGRLDAGGNRVAT